MTRLGFWTGALVGALLTAMLVSVAFVGYRLAGLPFPPYGLFDWTTRRLPGAVVTAGIDAMVAAIGWLSVGPTADVAKVAEQSMAIIGFVLAGAVVGGLVFLAIRGLSRRLAGSVALLVGGLVGVGMVGLAVSGGAGGPAASVGVVSVFVLGVAWGMSLGASYRRLSAPARGTPAEPGGFRPAAGGRAPAREPDRPSDVGESSPLRTAPSSPSGGRESGDRPPAGPVYADPRGRVTVEPIDRRSFLVRLGAATAVVTVAGAAVGAIAQRNEARAAARAAGAEPWSATNRLPNADSPVRPVRGTRPELTPVPDHYRIDINTRPPVVDAEAWRLSVGGLVARPLELSIAELREFEPIHQFVTLSCISNRVGGDLISTTRWSGVSLQRLLPVLGLANGASYLVVRSADGFHEVVSLDLAAADPRVMLCYDWDGLPLPEEHGFPLRLYVPDAYGMKQPKWIESIEATAAWRPGYWVLRGWDRDATVEATAVVDTVATDMMMPRMDTDSVIPIGGIAYAGARGISRVEVRVDDGPWTPAEQRAPISETTWVIWRYDWPFTPGDHTVRVRCYDGTGNPQTVEPSPPHPDGATGLHSVRFTV